MSSLPASGGVYTDLICCLTGFLQRGYFKNFLTLLKNYSHLLLKSCKEGHTLLFSFFRPCPIGTRKKWLPQMWTQGRLDMWHSEDQWFYFRVDSFFRLFSTFLAERMFRVYLNCCNFQILTVLDPFRPFLNVFEKRSFLENFARRIYFNEASSDRNLEMIELPIFLSTKIKTLVRTM